MASLLTTRGTRIDLSTKRKYFFGRDAGCDILVDDVASSRMHATLRIAGEQMVTIEDLGSRNGTFVNDRRLTEVVALDDNSRIRIGSVTYMLSFVDAGQSPSPFVPSVEVSERTMPLIVMEPGAADRRGPTQDQAAEIAGQIGPFSVVDVLRFVLGFNINGSLRFAFERSDAQIEIRGGQLWHAAESDGLSGEAALTAITGMTAGLFWFVPGSEPSKQTIFSRSTAASCAGSDSQRDSGS